MSYPAFKIAPLPRPEIRTITVQDLPWRAAANSNVEAVESFAQKCLRVGGKVLGHTLFYAQFLEFEGDTAHHTPAIDQPPQGKTVPQWLLEMEEATHVAIAISDKQAEVRRHQMNGQKHLARHAQQQLDELLAYAQAIQNSTSTPITSGALKMVATTESAATTNAPNNPPNFDSIEDILARNPSQLRTSGGIRYPRLEALVAHLVEGKLSPRIVERGPGDHAEMAMRLGSQYHITLIDERTVLERLGTFIATASPTVRANIHMAPLSRSLKNVPAHVCLWIHPNPRVLLSITDEWSDDPSRLQLNLPLLGQDVVPGGYLIIQTEILPVTGRTIEDSEWELVYEGTNTGFLAPSRFTNSNIGRTIVLRRKLEQLPSDWHALALADPNAFAVRAHIHFTTVRAELAARIVTEKHVSAISAWYQAHALLEIEAINTAFKVLIPPTSTMQHTDLAWELIEMKDTIPTILMAGDLNLVQTLIAAVGK